MHNKTKAKATTSQDFEPMKTSDYSEKDDTGFLQLFSQLSDSNRNVILNNPYIANQVMKSLTTLPTNYSREEINKMLANPRNNEDALVGLSYYVKNVILQYQNTIEYFSTLNEYTPFVYPVGIDEFDKKEKEFKKTYHKAIGIVDDMDIQALANRIVKATLIEDSKFYYLVNTECGYRLVELPRQWCKITAWSQELGMYLCSFNMLWFKRIGVDVDQYGEWWIDALEEMDNYKNNILPKPYDVEVEKKHDGSGYAYWKELPVGFGWVFKYDNTTAVSMPPLSGLFNDALAIENYKQLYNDNAVLQNWKLLLNKIGFNDDGKGGNNKLKLSADFASTFNEGIQNKVPRGVSSAVSVFDDTQVVDFSKNAQTKDNVIGTAQSSYFASTGVSQNVMGGDKGGATGTTYSHFVDSEKISKTIVPQLTAFLNYILRENVKPFRWRVGFEVTTAVTKDSTVKLNQGLANSGLPITRLLASAGITQAEFEGCVAMEGILGTREKLIPLLNANTVSGTEAIDGKTKEKTDRSKISDSTDDAIENGDRDL